MPRVRASAAVLLIGLGAGASVSWGASPSPGSGGATTVAVDVIDARTRDLTIRSPSVGTVQVRLLLPAGFEGRPDARYPVLYLLHGGGGEYDDWTIETDVEAYTAAEDLLVVMPAAASSHLGPDEAASPDLGALPDWETFHVVELPRLLERDWRAGDARAIGGLSLGGYGAVMYAARHPELFRAVASYSGALDLAVAPGGSAAAQALIDLAGRLAEDGRWEDSNPVNVVAALAGLDVYVSYGDGVPGPLDPAGREPDPLEAWIGTGGERFVGALDEAGVPATVDAYGPGTHSWPYWDRELVESLPMFLDALHEAQPATSAIP